MPGTDYTFKKGERIIIDPYSVHRDPEYFENPDKFDPDRFSPKNRDRKVIDAFIGFGKGPRKCPGKNVDELFNDASQQRLKRTNSRLSPNIIRPPPLPNNHLQ